MKRLIVFGAGAAAGYVAGAHARRQRYEQIVSFARQAIRRLPGSNRSADSGPLYAETVLEFETPVVHSVPDESVLAADDAVDLTGSPSDRSGSGSRQTPL
ncbi:MAG: hypothetical protein EPO13_01530 [Actinomycetota bacterium]|nr:MAG: hypothetical protein EPO13_01530 [Actinomycetota bacterium]